MAGVVDEDVVERRALHRQRRDGDAGLRAPPPSAPRWCAGRCASEMRKTWSSACTSATSGSASQRLRPAGRHLGEADLEDVLAGDRRLQLERRIERDQLAVIDDGDAVAELVGLVHVVGGDQDGQVALALEARRASPRRRRARPGRGRWSARRGRRSCGSCTRPRAISRRRRMPPENILTGLSAHCVEVDGLEQLVDDAPPALARDAVELGEDAHVLLGAEVEVGGHRLRDDADAGAHVVGVADDVEAVDARRAAASAAPASSACG